LALKAQKQQSLWFSVVVLFAINILNFYDRHVPGALVEPMREEFHLNDTQIGLLGSAFIWIYAIVGVPLGRIADSASRKKLLAWGVVIWTALTASAGLAITYAMLLLSRVGVGVGEASCAPAATSWLGDLFPPAKRSRVLALFMMGVPVGGGLGYLIGGPIAQAYGWRAAMVLAAVPAILLVPALLMLEEPVRGASEPDLGALARASIWNVLRIPTLWWIIASGALLNFNAYAFATFIPAFLHRVHGLSVARSGMATGVLYLIGGVSGGLLSGHLGDYIVHRRKDGRMLCAAAVALVTVPLACIGILQPAGALLTGAVFLGLTYASISTYYGFVYSAIQDIVAPNQRAATMAIYFMAMYMCGASLGPLLTGRISDVLAHRAAALAGSATVTESFRAVGLQQAMLIIPVLSVALAFVLYMGSRTIIADIERRETLARGASRNLGIAPLT
jgi:predicted MFS family arabinose efflux permease